MDSLPDELHLMILSFLDPKEWRVTKYAQYRLISRRFAAIGAQKMFESFQFRPTTTALVRMNNMIDAGLARYIQTLDFEGEVDLERQSPDHTNYLVPVKTEELRFQIFREIMHGFAHAKSPVEWIGAHHFPSSFFREDNMPTAFSHVKNLDLRIDAGPKVDAHRGVQRLRHYVESLSRVEMMDLAFGEEKDWLASRYKPPMLQDVIPLDGFRWTKLRCLCLEYLMITDAEVISLLAAHAATLKCFHFKGFRMVRGKIVALNDRDFQRKWWENEQLGWRNTFAQIARMEVLKHASLSSLSPRVQEEEKVWKVKMQNDGRTIDVKTDLVKWLEQKKLARIDA
jgi:hypothetical protein